MVVRRLTLTVFALLAYATWADPSSAAPQSTLPLSWIDGGVDAPPMPPAPTPIEADVSDNSGPFRIALPDPADMPQLPAPVPTAEPDVDLASPPPVTKPATRLKPKPKIDPVAMKQFAKPILDDDDDVTPSPQPPVPPSAAPQVYQAIARNGWTYLSTDPAWLSQYVADRDRESAASATTYLVPATFAASSSCGPGGCPAPSRRSIFGR